MENEKINLSQFRDRIGSVLGAWAAPSQSASRGRQRIAGHFTALKRTREKGLSLGHTASQGPGQLEI